jgi:hypothetical protein
MAMLTVGCGGGGDSGVTCGTAETVPDVAGAWIQSAPTRIELGRTCAPQVDTIVTTTLESIAGAEEPFEVAQVGADIVVTTGDGLEATGCVSDGGVIAVALTEEILEAGCVVEIRDELTADLSQTPSVADHDVRLRFGGVCLGVPDCHLDAVTELRRE